MNKHQSLLEDEIWALYRISHSTFIMIQNAFKFGSLPGLSEWRRILSKLLHSKFVEEKISHFVNQAQTQVTVKDVQLFFLKFYWSPNSFPYNHQNLEAKDKLCLEENLLASNWSWFWEKWTTKSSIQCEIFKMIIPS